MLNFVMLKQDISYYNQLHYFAVFLSSEHGMADASDIGRWISLYPTIVLAYDGNTIVGYCVIVYSPSWKESSPALLDVFYLDKRYRGHGYGKEMAQYAIQKFYEKKYKKDICLFVESENTRAIHIYEKLGFEKTSEHYHGFDLDIDTYQYTLKYKE